jgi:hypothetical protein
MSTPTERDLAAALEAVPPILLGAGPRVVSAQAEEITSDDHWKPIGEPNGELPNGEAWVFWGEGNSGPGLVSPVIMADGFNSGPSTLPFSWTFLEEKDFPFISALRARGKDVIILGFTERSDSILKNSDAAIAAIEKAIALRDGNNPLVVGGFSMGGLVTRYALAKMEHDGHPNREETGVYFSYDSPHRGAYIPISLLAFAHYPPIRDRNPAFSDQMNSDAAQELLWRHISTSDETPDVSDKRKEFLNALKYVGEWPRIPRLLAVANGVGTGVGNGIDASKTAVRGKPAGESTLAGTDLRTMPDPDDLAAILQVILKKKEVRVSGLPAVDGAPGGTLDSFKILADALNTPPEEGPHLTAVDLLIEEHCFVPAVSAVDVRDLDTNDDLYTPIEPSEESGLEYMLATQNEAHTKVTEELCTWLLDRF